MNSSRALTSNSTPYFDFLSTVYFHHHHFLKLSNFDFALFLFKDIQQHPESSDCP